MYTRCPQCKAVHAVNAANLAQARGLVQCGPCGRTFSALSFLFDEWPEGEPCRPENGPGATLPVLEPAPETGDAGNEPAPETGDAANEPVSATGLVENEPATDAEPSAPAPETIEDELPAARDHRLAWRMMAVMLTILTVANLAWTFRQPLLSNPTIGAWFKQQDELQADERGLLRDPEQIQLVSRDMHTHPTRSGILVLSLTFVNLASRKQEFPQLEVTLTDASNQPVARRRLQPAEYLRPGADIDAGLAADVYLPVLLELGDPGEQAVGFEIRFL